MPERQVTDRLERANDPDMKIIAIANQKGGTAKTTTTAALGVLLSRKGQRVHLLDMDPGINIFFGLYYTITGLHGLHVIIGMVLLSISLVLVMRDKITAERYAMLENSGLYWHLVDLIWIYVFPLFYLVL